MNCKSCNQLFGKIGSSNQTRIIPCGHTICEQCLKQQVNHSIILECPYCPARYDTMELRVTPVNHLYYEMLSVVDDFIERKKWEENNRKDDDDQQKQELARVSIEYKCLYTFCHRLRYEKDGMMDVFCSPKCMELNELLYDDLDEEAQNE